MKIARAALCAAMLLFAVRSAWSQGNLLPLPPEAPIRGMNTPAISPDGKTLCFSYLGDLWTAPSAGGTAARLTIHEAHDAFPRWSPDGRWIAFSSDRRGNYDVFLVPAEGGEARQVTFHTANDYVMDWSPDGSRILFYSMRGTEHWQLYSIEVTTGVVHTLTNDDEFVRYGAWSPDGKTIAYDRCGGIAVWWRPRYHGSANYRIYTKSLATGKITRVTEYDGTDLWPMWSHDGRYLYYASDQLTPGSPNLLEVLATGGKPRLVTRQTGDAVRWPSISRDGSTIVYVYAGDLYAVRPGEGKPRKVVLYAPTDEKQNNVVRLTLTNSATEAEIAPDGKTLALVIRGELWTIPSESGGDATRLTNNPANDYDILWSPDSTKLAFASDRSGNFDIYTIDVKTKAVKPLSTDPNDENGPQWSPDGKSIAFLRSGPQGGLYVANSDGSGVPRRVAASEGNNVFGVGITDYSWSLDSQWLAFTRRDPTDTRDIWVVPAAGGREVNVTYYPGTNGMPVWSADGKHLLFLSDRDRESGMDLYSVPLQKERADDDGKQTGGAQPAKPTEKQPVAVKIDFDDIENRAARLTTQGAGPFQVTPDGRLAIFTSGDEYWSVPVGGGPPQRLTSGGEGANLPRFATDPNRFWALGPNGTVRLVQHAGPVWVAVPVGFSAVMDLDRRQERHEAFNEFWRRIKVGFYDPRMHGVDWQAVRAKYEPLLAGVGTREEFALFFLSQMVGELNASHSEVSPAPTPGPPQPQTAELGLTFDESYAGPGLKVTGYMPHGPDDDLGPRIKPGEYVMQIDGQDVSWNEAMYGTLLGKSGKTVELLVGSRPTREGARTVKLKAITTTQWADLEYERKVKAARDQVDQLSGGRLAYIHIRGMDQASLKKVQRELWGRGREKDGLVLDVRDNGGGNTHDEILSQISRPAYAWTQPRDGLRSSQPLRHWDKPTVLLINEDSASDAEIFPNGFRQLKLGKIVGEPTPGYVIGTYDGQLQDGTRYRVPMWGWYTLDGKDLENVGVKPDITVEPTPEDMAAHRDRQLETAVQTLVKELPKK